MKLSEAIRKGAALRPQAHGDYIDILADGRLATCAIGAAYEGLTGQLPPTAEDDDGFTIREICAAIPTQEVIINDIILRNDKLAQTREEIAAWLEEQGL